MTGVDEGANEDDGKPRIRRFLSDGCTQKWHPGSCIAAPAMNQTQQMLPLSGRVSCHPLFGELPRALEIATIQCRNGLG
ncbi:MAG TPA: hypothetical protein VE820_04230 [Sphingomicrobium sp.]|nr:hypothetical protein [Sphingomicrobium sp.]